MTRKEERKRFVKELFWDSGLGLAILALIVAIFSLIAALVK